MPTTQDMYDEWISNPERPILLVDETREIAPEGHGQFILFTCVHISVEVLNDYLYQVEEVRAGLSAQIAQNSIKGRHLFGAKPVSHYNRIKDAALVACSRAAGIFQLLTTSTHVIDTKLHSIGKINTDTGEVISGPELLPVLNFAKWIGSRIKPPPKQIDLIIDRSAHLGLDPHQRNIQHTDFNVLGPGYLNTTSQGGPTELLCPSLFRIIAGSDKLTHLRDLLLLPDAVGYLGLFTMDMSKVKDEVLAGTQFRIIEADMSVFTNRRMVTGQ